MAVQSGYSRRLGGLARLTLIGAAVGAVGGSASGVLRVASQRYLALGLDVLALDMLRSNLRAGVAFGAAGALGWFAVCAAAYAVLARLLGNRERARAAAIASVPVGAAFVWVGAFLNRTYLPGLFEAPSILANLALAAASVALWVAASWAVRWLLPLLPSPRAATRAAVAVLAVWPAVELTALVRAPHLAPNQPNVLLIVIDTLRQDRLSCDGYPRQTTPNIDRLASRSWVFRQALSSAPWTKPSMASVFTSLYPRQHGVGFTERLHPNDPKDVPYLEILSPSLLTFPELFANAGYRTGGFGHNWHLIREMGFDQGFQRYEWELGDDSPFTAAAIHRHFLDWLDAGDGPFFGYVHHIDVHWPYRAPAPFAGSFTEGEPAFDYNSVEFMESLPGRPRPLDIDPATVRHMSDAYDEGIRYVDDEIGKLLDALETRGLLDSTLIVVTSDHGEEFLEHGDLNHGQSLDDELIRVPLIVHFPCPGPHCGARTIDTQVELVDLMPTLLGVAGIETPHGLSGRDLIEEHPDAARMAWSEVDEFRALRTPALKYIRTVDGSKETVYDLRLDPTEQHDIASSDPRLLASLRESLELRRLDIDAASQRSGEHTVADVESIEQLHALGYLE